MLTACHVIAISLPFILYQIRTGVYIARHRKRYTEADCYALAQRVIRIMKVNGGIRTKAYGMENLPKEGGYVMYSNHQGKYDALGIMGAHKEPCTIMMDAKRSHLPIVDPFMTLIQGSRLDKTDMRSQVETIHNMVREVEAGRRYIVFPEGGYFHNRNEVKEFMPGAFKTSIKSKTPIVPVAIIDSYKPFELNSLRPVETQVHFLKPISFEEYEGMNTREIAQMVRARIVATIAKQLHAIEDLQRCLDESEALLDEDLMMSCMMEMDDIPSQHRIVH